MEFKSSGRDAGLDKDLQTAIFRIAQEALTNAARHADAKRVTIKLEVASSHVEMIVADHGKGMGSMRAPQAGSLGLIGMQQRAHMWGGVINIVSTPRVGTTVRLKIPLIPAGPDVGDPAHV
jgi:signal transduction histidine kinase